jgi:Rrf2 family protein
MVVIPRQVEYALMALREMSLAEPGQVFAVRALCARHGVPFDVMSRTLQRLNRSGVLRGVRGVAGGYQLIRHVGTLTLLDIFEAVNGPLSSLRCLRKPGGCKLSATCTVAGSMKLLDERIRELYGAVRVSDLLSGKLAGKDPDVKSPTRAM